MSKIHQIDFSRMAVLLLPCRMRGVRLMSLVRALVAPVASLSARRLAEREERLFWLRTTGQRRLLRYALNKYFGVEGFEIEDATSRGKWLMVYDESEAEKTIIDNTTLLYDEATTTGEDAFVVRYPRELEEKTAIIRIIVSRYKMAGKSFRMESI